MKHFTVFLFFALIFILPGCRAKKNITFSENISSISDTVEIVADSSQVEEKSQINQITQTNEQDNSYIRVTEFDSSGTIIQRITEEWRDIGRSGMTIFDESRYTLSLEGMSSITVSNDSSLSSSSQHEESSNDSRPIQGTEWLWVILGIAIVLSILIFVLIKKNKK